MSDRPGTAIVTLGPGAERDGRTVEPSLPAAIRGEPAAVLGLLAAAGVAWWMTVDAMSGMDGGPGTDLGALGWFTGAWTLMMAAMMLPSLSPTVAVLAAPARRDPVRVGLFACGYLLVWVVAGLTAYGVFELGKAVSGDVFAWHDGGRWVAGGVLVAAAGYQLTPYKRAFLRRCRSPLGFLGASPRATRPGALVAGLRSGAWCLGCSWALIAALFALGVMSLQWMVVVAVLIGAERLPRASAPGRLAGGAVLLALALGVAIAPASVPGLTVPGSPAVMRAMQPMSSARG